ncbi:MAG: 30S ribosomal protein S3ae [Thermoprotei archaeon]|nr:MAG: 30S ribosomal protein S3ae [Thermoprotei archaeon]
MPAPRSARDRWVLKRWFPVYASSAFGYAEIGEIPANLEKSLIGRTIEVRLFQITGDFTQAHIKLKFQVVKVVNGKAFTQFKGFELARDYLRSLVRRGTTKVDGIFDVETKDGVRMRVAVMVITQHRVKTSQEKAIRRIAKEVVEARASMLTFDEFVREAVLGKVASEVFNKARKIYPLRKVEVRKIKVLTKTFDIPLKIPEELRAPAREAAPSPG